MDLLFWLKKSMTKPCHGSARRQSMPILLALDSDEWAVCVPCIVVFFFCSDSLCLVSARSDGPDHADSLRTPYVSRAKKVHMPPAAVGRIFGLWIPVT